jgi:dTDP-4-amino-4,6-dideoxygalactose transaminase
MKLFFSSGTAAFKAGLILLNIKSNDEILIPQFVCDVLIQPLKELNIKQIYFKIKKDFSVA